MLMNPNGRGCRRDRRPLSTPCLAKSDVGSLPSFGKSASLETLLQRTEDIVVGNKRKPFLHDSICFNAFACFVQIDI